MSLKMLQARRVAIVFAIVLALDQISKAIIRATLDFGTPYRGDVFFYFVRHQNTGLVGGVFSGVPYIGYLAPLLAFAVLVYLYRHLNPVSRWQSLAYGLVLGGAVGNIIDRVVFGAVTDFLQFHFYFIPFDFPWKYYPAFNLADSAIVIGVALLVLTWHSGEHENAPSTV